MAKIITATIDPETGDVDLELDGYKGKGCHAIQEVFHRNLGGESKKLTRKPEFNVIEPNTKCVIR